MLIRLKRDQIKSVKTVMLISSFYSYVLLFIFNVAICSITVHSLNITKKNWLSSKITYIIMYNFNQNIYEFSGCIALFVLKLRELKEYLIYRYITLLSTHLPLTKMFIYM